MAGWGDSGSIKSRKQLDKDAQGRKPEPPSISFSQAMGHAPLPSPEQMQQPQSPPKEASPMVAWMGAGGFQFQQAYGSPTIEAMSPSGQRTTLSPGMPGYTEVTAERDMMTGSSGVPNTRPLIPPTSLPPNYDGLNNTGSSVTIDPQFGPESASQPPVVYSSSAPAETSTSGWVVSGAALVAILAAAAAGLYFYSYGMPKLPAAAGPKEGGA